MTSRSPFRTRKTLTISFLLFLLLLAPSIVTSVDDRSFTAYIERFAAGYIDWDNGYIYGIGRSYLESNAGSRVRAQGAARVIAEGNIVKLAAGVRLDDKRKLAALGNGKVVIQLKAFIKVEEVSSRLVENDGKPYYEVTRRSPIAGVEGLTSKLITRLRETPFDWREFPDQGTASREASDDEETWVVLDARGLPAGNRVKPALFPKVQSATGETIHSLEKAEEGAVIQRGMARYVESDEPLGNLGSDPDAIARFLAATRHLFGPADARATDKIRRKKRKRYIVKKVSSASGLMQTNLVVSADDAKKLVQEDNQSHILKKCRVIVVVSSPIGGVEGKRHPEALDTGNS
jgi:hypothetical protein